MALRATRKRLEMTRTPFQIHPNQCSSMAKNMPLIFLGNFVVIVGLNGETTGGIFDHGKEKFGYCIGGVRIRVWVSATLGRRHRYD